MKRLPIFIAGVAVGALAVIVALYRDVLSKQPQPTLGTSDDSLLINDRWPRIFWKPPVRTELSTTLTIAQPVEYPKKSGWYVVKEKYKDKPHKRYFNVGLGSRGKFVHTPDGDELVHFDNICIPHKDVEWWQDAEDDNLYNMTDAEVKDFLEGMKPFPFVNTNPSEMSLIELEEYIKLMKRDINKGIEKSTDKTQPVYVGQDDEVGAWDLDRWAKESE
jgi:hypothetical protein